MQCWPKEACDSCVNWPETLSHEPWDTSPTVSCEFTTIIMKLNDKEFQMYTWFCLFSVWLCICIQSNACKLFQRQKECVCVCLPEWGQSPLPSSPSAATWMRSIHPPAGRQSFAAIRCRHGDRLLYPRPQPPFPRHRAVYSPARWPEMGSHGNTEQPAYHTMAPFSFILPHE